MNNDKTSDDYPYAIAIHRYDQVTTQEKHDRVRHNQRPDNANDIPMLARQPQLLDVRGDDGESIKTDDLWQRQEEQQYRRRHQGDSETYGALDESPKEQGGQNDRERFGRRHRQPRMDPDRDAYSLTASRPCFHHDNARTRDVPVERQYDGIVRFLYRHGFDGALFQIDEPGAIGRKPGSLEIVENDATDG